MLALALALAVLVLALALALVLALALTLALALALALLQLFSLVFAHPVRTLSRLNPQPLISHGRFGRGCFGGYSQGHALPVVLVPEGGQDT